MLKAVNDFTKKKYEGDDVREGLVGAVAIRLKDPVFESQTKNKLGNTEIRGDLVKKVQDVVSDLLHRNPEAAEKIAAKVEDTARLRRELASVKKLARERSAATTLRIPQLKDCKMHLNQKRGGGEGSMVFLTEGQSAAGSLVSCRDVMTQAIFVLKGKPLNVNDLKRAALYKNDELYNLMRALNIEDSIDGLRYEKVILATDADVDGLHIRNLLITFFLRFFPDLVVRGHVHILETPLFRVRNKKKTVYCYDEAERVAAPQEHRGTGDHAVQGAGGDQPGGVQGIRGPGHPADARGSGEPARHAAHPGLLHGQEHARAPQAHHGSSDHGGRGGAGSGRCEFDRIACVLWHARTNGASLRGLASRSCCSRSFGEGFTPP